MRIQSLQDCARARPKFRNGLSHLGYLFRSHGGLEWCLVARRKREVAEKIPICPGRRYLIYPPLSGALPSKVIDKGAFCDGGDEGNLFPPIWIEATSHLGNTEPYRLREVFSNMRINDKAADYPGDEGIIIPIPAVEVKTWTRRRSYIYAGELSGWS